MADLSVDPTHPRPRRIPHTLIASIVAFAIPWIHGFAPDFLYDAAQYWGGATALLTGADAVAEGSLPTRGVLTTLVYLVPAAVTSVLGPESAMWTVLAWNAAFAAAVTAVLLPRLATLLSPQASQAPPPSRIWISAILGSFLLSGFARFPLVDVWSTALALAGFYGLAVGRRWWSLSLAGIAAVAAVNMRPSLIPPLILAVVVLLVLRPRAVLLAVPAALVTFVPQLMLNVRVWGLWSAVPPETIPLSAVQAAPAPFALRYDTVAFAEQRPQQWFCDPGYAQLLLEDRVPHNQVGVVGSAVRHLPDSIWFLFRKAAANLHWSLATPYENPPEAPTDLMAPLVLAVAVLGFVALVMTATARRIDRRTRLTTIALLGFWFGALATLVFSTPETRFALPLVLVGLIGVVSAVPPRSRWVAPDARTLIALAVAAVLFAALFLSGVEALSHAMPPGPLADAATCAAT